jgi:hypothetical protein
MKLERNGHDSRDTCMVDRRALRGSYGLLIRRNTMAASVQVLR